MTLPQKGDLVVLDELVQASAHEGARAGGAEAAEATRNDTNAVDDTIRSWRVRCSAGRA